MAAALLVHALDEQAKAFYLAPGFIESPIEPMTLMLNPAFSGMTDECRIHIKRDFCGSSEVQKLPTARLCSAYKAILQDSFAGTQ